MKKMLVIQTASIGDVILATPVIEKLHFFYPEAKIDCLVKKGIESLFESHPFIHQILTWEKSKNKNKNLLELIFLIRYRKYDAIINVQRFISSGLITVFSGAKVKIGFDKNPLSIFFNIRIRHTIRHGNLHEVNRNLKLVEKITDATFSPVKLYPGQQHFAKMSQYKTVQYITISPASLWFTKQYPKEKWIEFVQAIKHDIRIYFLGSQKDVELCREIIEISGYRNSINLAGKLSLLESAAIMKDAQMNFMNDSAPMHLASAVNAPTTAIFCSTIPEFGFGPLADQAAVVETGEDLECRPCGLHGYDHCPKKHFKCGITIDTQKLLNRLNEYGR